MNYEFVYEEDFLIIRLSGIAGVNERLLVEEYLAPHLLQSCQKNIVDLESLNETGGVFLLGILNAIKKEFQLIGGEIKLCSLRPDLYRYFKENRLDRIFDICQSVEQAKRSFEEKRNEG
jgi:anti-anti-sigma regulatory factor